MATVTRHQERAVNEFVDKLTKRMRETGKTPTQLAKEAGVGRPYLYRVLSGEQTPSLEWAAKVGGKLGLKIKTVET